MMKEKRLTVFLKGLILENPVLVLILGTCPTLAQTGSMINALSMGLAATVVLVCSNSAISALRKIIPDTVRIPCYIVIIAAFVTVVQLLLQAFLPSIYEMMGVYLALIVVNCIILGRAEMFARKHGVLDSAVDGLGMGLGFLLALFAMAFIREIFGAGTFFGLKIPFLYDYRIPFLVAPPGGFLVFGILIAVIDALGVRRGKEKRKEFSCEGCPSRAVCNKTFCNENIELVNEDEQTPLNKSDALNSEKKEGGK